MADNLRPVAPPTGSDVLTSAQRQTMRAINCVQVGKIEAFDPATQLASIKLALKQIKDIAEDGTRTYQDYPLLLECPVVTLFGGLDFLSFPIAKGDSCLVLFNDRELDQWLYQGAGAAPLTLRMHDLSDGIAIVGIKPLTESIAGYLANGIRLSHGGGDATVDLKTGLIETVAALFLHHGNMRVSGDAQVDGSLTVLGVTRGDSGNMTVDSNVTLTGGNQLTAPALNAENGASGTFSTVTVVNGIVVAGS